MKKIYSFIAAFVICTGVVTQSFAQTDSSTETGAELKSKKGTPILPEAGEYALGISANPFLEYVGNFLNGTNGNNAPTFDFVGNPAGTPFALYGKKMLNANTALRARFALNVASRTNKVSVIASSLTPSALAPVFVEDWRRESGTNILLAGGYEKRRGKGRLQGIYGGEFLFGLSGNRVSYQYGNTITQDFNFPNTNGFAPTGNFGSNLGAPGIRTVSEKNNNSVFLGLRAFVGVEYFFAPKISVGGEFGYIMGLRTQGKGLITTETWDSAAGQVRSVQTEVFKNGGLNSIGIGTENLNGAINFLFYF